MTDIAAPAPIRLADITADMTDPYEADSLARFVRDVTDHEMTVLQDDGVYRHLRFRNPAAGWYWFDIITSPGLLTLNGDVGTFVFSRLQDMFDFFTGNHINPSYWGEKLRASSAYRANSTQKLKTLVREDIDQHTEDWPEEVIEQLRGAAEDEVLMDVYTNDEAHRALRDFRWSHTDEDGETYRFEFYDSWEMDLQDYEPQFLWACHAIRAAVRAYAQYTAVPEAEPDKPAEVAA